MRSMWSIDSCSIFKIGLALNHFLYKFRNFQQYLVQIVGDSLENTGWIDRESSLNVCQQDRPKKYGRNSRMVSCVQSRSFYIVDANKYNTTKRKRGTSRESIRLSSTVVSFCRFARNISKLSVYRSRRSSNIYSHVNRMYF